MAAAAVAANGVSTPRPYARSRAIIDALHTPQLLPCRAARHQKKAKIQRITVKRGGKSDHGRLLLRELPGDCRQRPFKCYGAAINASIVGRTTPNRRNADRKFLSGRSHHGPATRD